VTPIALLINRHKKQIVANKCQSSYDRDVLISTLHLCTVGFPMTTRVTGNVTVTFTTQYLYLIAIISYVEFTHSPTNALF